MDKTLFVRKRKVGAGEWLVPFKGRNHSGAYNQNFLWRRGSIYVMDNHRAALWCWLQHINPQEPHSLFHIDRHTDTLQSRLDEWIKHLPSSWNLTIDEYLSHSYQYEMGTVPLFRWDNYLSIYLSQFGSSLDKCFFATHDDGDKPNHRHVFQADLWDLPTNMDYWLGDGRRPWIMNVDLDYFFWDDSERPGMMVSDAFLSELFSPIRRRIEDGTIGITTICLTPDECFTGGWHPSERLAEKVLKLLGVNFRLPRSALRNDRMQTDARKSGARG